jgi:sulfite reductase alpha subunit-like flavoprotein
MGYEVRLPMLPHFSNSEGVKDPLRSSNQPTEAASSFSSTMHKPKIYVLYGSQTGNSEQAAQDFCHQCATELRPERRQTHARTAAAQSLIDGNSNTTAATTSNGVSTETFEEMLQAPLEEMEAVAMQLDDFLELEHAPWTRLIVIFVSSYGIGSAPLGSYRFRELCDAWTGSNTIGVASKRDVDHKDTVSSSSHGPILDGVYFALCGLGDSKFTTYFNNPTAIDAGLRSVGAQRVGELGRADASGAVPQQEVIARWMESIWPHLAYVLVTQPPLTKDQWQSMQASTVKLCADINPDFQQKGVRVTKSDRDGLPNWLILLAVAIGLVALFPLLFSAVKTQPV